jgi:hypothetical protein
MRLLFNLLLLCLITSCLAAQSLTQCTYEGSITGSIPITLTLTQDGQALFGTVVYKKKGVPIRVVGKLESGSLFLHELLDKGAVTGIYSLSKQGQQGEWKGIWNAPKPNAKDLEVTLREVARTTVPRKVQPDLMGTYTYSFGKEAGSGELRVLPSGPGKIALSANAVTGRPAYNMAIIDKITLSLNGNRALYQTREFGNCKLLFTFHEKAVQVDYIDGAYECGFGHNATVAGNYLRTQTAKPIFE